MVSRAWLSPQSYFSFPRSAQKTEGRAPSFLATDQRKNSNVDLLLMHVVLLKLNGHFTFAVSYVSNWNLEMLVFEARGKPEYPEKNLTEQGREPTNLNNNNKKKKKTKKRNL